MTIKRSRDFSAQTRIQSIVHARGNNGKDLPVHSGSIHVFQAGFDIIDPAGQRVPVDPFTAEDGAPGDKEFPFLPGLDGESRAVFSGPHILDEIRGGDMGVRIDDHRFLPVSIDPARILLAEHKEPDPDHDQSDEKEGAEENEGHGEERAKEVSPVTRRLFGRGNRAPERPETASRASRCSATPAKSVRRIQSLSAMAAFGHGRIIG
jgi:hypothetical protein